MNSQEIEIYQMTIVDENARVGCVFFGKVFYKTPNPDLDDFFRPLKYLFLGCFFGSNLGLLQIYGRNDS